MLSVTTKLELILNGFKNLAFPNPEVEKIAKERAKICAECEHNKIINTILGIKPFSYNGCDICKCYINAKVRSVKPTNKCPDGRW
jgi:hypothetical protein